MAWGLVLIFIMATGVFAEDEYRIKASTDRKSASVGDKIILTVTVSSNASISVQPSAPELKDFDVIGTSSSNRISIVNGAQAVEMSNIYVVRPLKAGKLVIGEFSLNYNDSKNISRSVKTIPITIEVTEAEEKKDDPAPTIEPQKNPKEPLAEDKNGIISNFMKVTFAVVIFIFASIWFIMWQSSRREIANDKKEKHAMAEASEKLHINLKSDHEETENISGKSGEAPIASDANISVEYDAGGAMGIVGADRDLPA
ncbi:MAG TPA: BatD family protein, partial [Candidatus Wallbacteria bacterium]|nr:BatD family protein [Candidatus Wallbacteria bacterium]